MAHKFDIKDKHKLGDEKRREMLPPEKTLLSLGLHEEDVMADVGCGIGFFTIPASKIVGENGKIYAMDIEPEMLTDVDAKIRNGNIKNVEIVLTYEDNLTLSNDIVSFAFISTVLHELEEKEKLLKEVKRILSPKGTIAIVEWKKENSEDGPPIEHRLDVMDLTKILDSLGYTDISSVDIGNKFYGITAKK